MSSQYENIITGYNNHVKYHDDMYNEEVKVIDFPFKKLFGDFRIFNGIRLVDMDRILGEIKKIMVNIANIYMQRMIEKRN